MTLHESLCISACWFCPASTKLNFLGIFQYKSPLSSFTKIRPVGAELFHPEAKSRISQTCERPSNNWGENAWTCTAPGDIYSWCHETIYKRIFRPSGFEAVKYEDAKQFWLAYTIKWLAMLHIRDVPCSSLGPQDRLSGRYFVVFPSSYNKTFT